MTEFRDFQGYLESQRPLIEEGLSELIASPKSEMKFGPDGVLTKLMDILTLYVSPNVNERRDQAIGLGLNPKRINNIDLNGSSANVAFRLTQYIGGLNEDSVHQLAERLKESFKESFK